MLSGWLKSSGSWWLADNRWIILSGGIFSLLIAIAGYYGFIYLHFLPLGILLLFFALFRLDILLKILIFFVPLSLQLSYYFPDLPIDMYLPTEPFLAGVLLLTFLKLLYERTFETEILTHPITLTIYFTLFWFIITTITSTMPLVSVKYLFMRLWFLCSFFFLFTQVFRTRKSFRQFIWLYTIPFLIVIGYTIFRHAIRGFDDEQAHYSVMNPFFRDHTSYGAALAFFIPVFAAFLFIPKLSGIYRFFIISVLLILVLALVLCRTRAAWLSLIGALGLAGFMLFRVRFRYVILTTVSAVLLIILSWTSIFMVLKKNDTESSTGNFSDHIESIVNVSSDASNMERINRWNCAIRMFEEKPFFGWGPGTYMFQYAPFQMSKDRTIISTNEGTVGNAHSEYLGALADSGLLGMLGFILTGLVMLSIGFRVYFRAKKHFDRLFIISLTMGIATYLIHSFLNNFLDTDKISAPFWGFAAILVVYDRVLLPINKGTQGEKGLQKIDTQ